MEGSSKGDQEAYVLTIHGTQFRIVTARFSSEYLDRVESHTMPLEQHLHVRRPRFYELKNADDRVEAVKACIGLVRYVLIGKTEMEGIKPIAKEFWKIYV